MDSVCPPPTTQPSPQPSVREDYCDSSFCYRFAQNMTRPNTTYSGPGPYPGGTAYKGLFDESFTVPMNFVIDGALQESMEFRTDGPGSILSIEGMASEPHSNRNSNR